MSYSFIHNHRRMVFDQIRNEAYFNTLQALITPDSIVLDLGAGLGLHGLMAAQLGAKKVYLVEPQGVIHMAKQIAKANGLADRVECLQGRIEDVALPEQVDIIVSVFTGNFLLEEDLLPSLFYARETYLKPDGHLIPNAAEMEAVPISLPDFYEERIGVWSQACFDLDLSLARRHATNTIYYDRKAIKQAIYLANPKPLLALDFQTAQDTTCRATVDYEITTAGVCHGFAGWFKIQVGETWLSTAPHAPAVHWRPAFLPLTSPITLSTGEWLKLYLTRPPYGHWSWRVTTPQTQQKQSTFIGQLLSPKAIRQANSAYQPACSAQGILVHDILASFDGQTPIKEIVSKIAKKHPDQSMSEAQLLRLVSDLAKQYGQ